MKVIAFILLFSVPFIINAQKHTVSGIVSDNETGERIIGACIYINDLNIGTYTNSSGFYSITVPKDSTVKLSCSFLSYEKRIINLSIKKDSVYNIRLRQTNNLEEVIIYGEDVKSLEIPVAGTNSIPLKQLKNLTSISGENDVLLVFQKMPGVQGGNEGTGSLFVRGGSADQNLYLIDNIPIYYVNHLGGFVSVFDENAINSLTIYKGGFPAEYSGKLSSVLDITLKNGNNKKLHGEIKVDILASKIFLEGPAFKNKATFMVSIRRCNLDLITRTLLRRNDSDGTNVFAYSFLDFNTKINIPVSEKNALSIFAYYGKDRMVDKFNGTNNPFESSSSYSALWNTKWGNKLIGIKWTGIISDKLFAETDIAYTGFKYESGSEIKEILVNTGQIIYENKNVTASGIDDLLIKFHADYYPVSGHKLMFGISATNHLFSPYSFNYFQKGTQYIDTVYGDDAVNTREYNAFFAYKGKFGNRFSANAGVHFSNYAVDSLKLFSIQPRIVSNLMLTKRLSFRSSYSKMTQFSHLISKSNIGLPSDVWLPATKFAMPENADIYSIGFVSMFRNIEISIESFYKTMNNLIELKESAYFFQNENWEDKIETGGEGTAYGTEFLIHKKNGKYNGWFAYTWTKNNRIFENINAGESFPYKYDRRHSISFVFNYEFTKKISFSCVWEFSTGIPLTVGIGTYPIQLLNNAPGSYDEYSKIFTIVNQNAVYYGGINNYRMPAYHRADVSVSFTKQKKHGKRLLQLGIYNVYNHLNPYFLYYQYDYKAEKMKLYQYSLFPIIPSFSYSFSF